MDCTKFRELLSEYAEGTLPPGLARAAQAHEAGCAACAAETRALRGVWAELDALPPIETPLFLHENIMTAVRRDAERRRATWRIVLPQLGRVALSTLLTGGAVAAIAWALLIPTLNPNLAGPDVQTGDFPPAGRILPGATEVSASEPRLRIRRSFAVDPEQGPSFLFFAGLENASAGTVRFDLLDKSLNKVGPSYRPQLVGGSAQPVLVPTTAAENGTINLSVYWTADGKPHKKELFVPVPAKDTKDTTVPVTPQPRQSFGLPESSLRVAAREVAARFGQPVTIEDVPDLDKITVVAAEETAAEALGRALASRGVRVTASRSGVLIEPAEHAAPSVPSLAPGEVAPPAH